MVNCDVCGERGATYGIAFCVRLLDPPSGSSNQEIVVKSGDFCKRCVNRVVEKIKLSLEKQV